MGDNQSQEMSEPSLDPSESAPESGPTPENLIGAQPTPFRWRVDVMDGGVKVFVAETVTGTVVLFFDQPSAQALSQALMQDPKRNKNDLTLPPSPKLHIPGR